MILRAATATDGPGIGKLFVGTPDAVGIDWTRPEIADWWIVAEQDGEIVGAIQATCSHPAGYIGELVLAPAWRGRHLAGGTHLSPRGSSLGGALYYAAEMQMRQAGVQCVTAVIHRSRGWRRIVERYGFTARAEGVTFMRKDLR